MAEISEKHIVAIDLGSSKIALTVVKVFGDDAQIVYYKDTASAGIKYSGVVNMGQAHAPLAHLVKDAEEALNIKINQAVIGMPKWPVRQEANSGKIVDRGEDTEITEDDIENLKRFAQETYPLSSTDREAIYGAVAQSFSDGESFQIKEEDIVGMSSDVLEGHFKIFIGKKKELKNADSLLAKVELSARKKYFTADTTAKVILSKTEMENGVALIDFGGGSTSVSIYHDGIMRHYASIPFGGKSITNDIRSELQITERLAENIKLAFGACMPEKLQNLSEKVLHIIGNNNELDKHVSVRYLSEVITARMEEILEAILYEINESGLAEHLRSGIVITGGAAQTVNLGMLISEMSGYRVRIGYPDTELSDQDVDGIHDTSAATVLGLIKAAMEEEEINCATDRDDVPSVEKTVVIDYYTDDKTIVETENTEEADTQDEHGETDTEETDTENTDSEKTGASQPENEKWSFLKVLWGKAQKVGNDITGIIDDFTEGE